MLQYATTHIYNTELFTDACEAYHIKTQHGGQLVYLIDLQTSLFVEASFQVSC